jgi:peptidoglycan/LPS O-acetylase OafA/YrhL
VIFQCSVRAIGLRLPLSILDCLQFFLVGFLLVDIYLNDWIAADPGGGATAARLAANPAAPARVPARYAWDLVFPFLLAAIAWAYHDVRLQALLPPLLFGLLVAVFRGCYVRKLLTASGVTVIGGMCYTIYLIHVQIIAVAGRITSDIAITNLFWANLLARSAVIGGFVVAASAVFFVLIEKPCMHRDWPQRLWRWLRSNTPRPASFIIRG